MNNERRKEIKKLIDRCIELKNDVELIRDEEQEYFDNMPESIQGGDKGERAQTAVDALEAAIGMAEDIENYLQEALEQ